ncbi:phage integrase family protein [Synechococcus sp. BIOS-E4-1]|uniref:site-specific integrase n=1 Tax=Synechococcus sp. BIOS-E4-1 TaxID=1400864 RepID=UPI001647D7BF|nr:site-specific integrase [Synechococcus sp. BIOS-E4-1]QNI53342.1 phage integrase family protein [Synechococcus sp. BIOS-E4-1]
MKILESIRLMGGDLLIQRFDDRPNYQARLYDRKNRRYITRSLRTTDQAVATDRAIALWRESMPLIEANVPLKAGSIAACIEDYYAYQQRRVEAGEIQAGALRDSRAQLSVALIYCGLQELTLLTHVQAHSFNEFLPWRRDKSLLITTGKAGIMRRSSLNKGIRELRMWWKWVKAQRLSEVELEIKELSTRREEPRQRNVAFTDADWKKLLAELKRWAFTEAKGPDWKIKRMRPVHWFGRRNFFYLMQMLVLSGLRPQEATQIITWNDLKFRNQGANATARALDSALVIRVRNDQGKGSRSVATNAGVLLKAFKKYSNDWRKENGYPQIKGSDLVFAYPPSNKAYSYTHYGKMFRDRLRHIGLEGKGYTIRSTRATYITDRLAEGKAPYIVARNCGHDLKVMMRDYEQLNEDQLINELL